MSRKLSQCHEFQICVYILHNSIPPQCTIIDYFTPKVLYNHHDSLPLLLVNSTELCPSPFMVYG